MVRSPKIFMLVNSIAFVILCVLALYGEEMVYIWGAAILAVLNLTLFFMIASTPENDAADDVIESQNLPDPDVQDSAEDKVQERQQILSDFQAQQSAPVQALTTYLQDLERHCQGVSSVSMGLTGRLQKADQSLSSVSENFEDVVTTVNNLANDMSVLLERAGIISDKVMQAADIASDAVEQTAETSSTVTSLADAVERIGEVVKLINDIAAQTNLLALNATIEAARAGEAGRGFAVVAQEVKALAAQTSQATDEIESQINQIQDVTKEAVNATSSTMLTIAQISEYTGEVVDVVTKQRATMTHLRTEIDKTTTRMSDVIEITSSSHTNLAENIQQVEKLADQVAEIPALGTEMQQNVAALTAVK